MIKSDIALGFIGAGNMAEAIGRGILAANIYRGEQMLAADPNPQRRAFFEEQLHITALPDSASVAKRSQTILLAVKPQMIGPVLEQLRPAISADVLVISIVAAVSTDFINRHLLPSTRVIRVMPNTPMLVGAGTSALAPGENATDDDLALATKIFGSCGMVLQIHESSMNAVTSLSGSGPAYVFYLCEALAHAGEQLGLSPADAQVLARQTIIGAGTLLAQSSESATLLRQKVTSPGGFTQAAIQSMEAANYFSIITSALQAAARRGDELAQK